MKLDVYGKVIDVERNHGRWIAFYIGVEGKKRRAQDIIIPDDLLESELVDYVADLCHEWATPNNMEVRAIIKPT